jgi:hypothetical protein
LFNVYEFDLSNYHFDQLKISGKSYFCFLNNA